VSLDVAKLVPEAKVTALDPSREMLAQGADKVRAAGLDNRITTVVGDGCALPFDDACFDGAVVSFGIRNIPDRALALREMARVCRPGSRVVVLELTEPRKGWLAPLARMHVHQIVPRIGALLSGHREYRYLQRSIAAFPPPDQFLAIMHNVGFKNVRSERLSLGAVHLFVGVV
ncbi:MAG: class I SAM-dependent methyltransferase, partial [Nannocystaceae bacterium]